MGNETSLKELIVNAQQEEEQQKYEKSVAPMRADIDKFVERLQKFCLSEKTLEVRIIYTIKNKSIVSRWFPTEIEEAWSELLSKWYFTQNGEYLIPAIRKIASEKGFSSRYDNEGWGWRKEMIYFTL